MFQQSVKAVALYFCSPFLPLSGFSSGFIHDEGRSHKTQLRFSVVLCPLQTPFYTLEKPEFPSVFSKDVPKHLILFCTFFLFLPTPPPAGF